MTLRARFNSSFSKCKDPIFSMMLDRVSGRVTRYKYTGSCFKSLTEMALYTLVNLSRVKLVHRSYSDSLVKSSGKYGP